MLKLVDFPRSLFVPSPPVTPRQQDMTYPLSASSSPDYPEASTTVGLSREEKAFRV